MEQGTMKYAMFFMLISLFPLISCPLKQPFFPFTLTFLLVLEPSALCLLPSALSSPKCKYSTGHDMTQPSDELPNLIEVFSKLTRQLVDTTPAHCVG
jgi:hypothetical protein